MKTKSAFLSLIISLFAVVSTAQQGLVLVKPEGSKTWGFVNLKGEMVIPATYSKVGEFTADGLAPVFEVEYYFINSKGEKLESEVKDFRLKNFMGFGIRGFNEGLAPIEVNKKWGYLNTSGKLVIPAKYDYVTAFKEGVATAKVGSQWYILDKQGKEIEVNIPKLKNLRDFVNGYAIFDNLDKKFGFINTKGEVVIEPKFTSVGDFHAGLAWAKNEQKLSGYINTTGEWVIEPTYNATHDFDEKSGMALVKVVNEWFYINKAGVALKLDFDKIDDFHNGMAIARKNEKVGFIDNTGKWSIEPLFEAARDFENGHSAVKSNGKWGIINTKGEWIIQPAYDAIRDVVLIK